MGEAQRPGGELYSIRTEARIKDATKLTGPVPVRWTGDSFIGIIGWDSHIPIALCPELLSLV